jgi:hypothetical protein
VRMDGSKAIYHLAGLVVVVKGITHKVDVLCKRLARAMAKHEVVKQRKGACQRATIQTFAQDIPSGSGAVRASSGHALDNLVSALVLAGGVQQHGARVGLRSFIELDSGVP